MFSGKHSVWGRQSIRHVGRPPYGNAQAGPINDEDTMTAVENADEAQRYDPRDIQDKWQTHWAAVDPFRASDDPADPRERFLLVDMFPYPSGDLHMGHAEAYAIGDAMAR